MAKKPQKDDNSNIIAKNRRAHFDYEIMEDYEAGIVLKGTEVKSLRLNTCNITDSYADIRYTEGGSPEVWLLNLNINTYKNAASLNHEPLRPRKLLMKTKQIKGLIGKLEQKGLTLIPLLIYFSRKGFVKIRLGLCRGKNEQDKRETIKTREWNKQKQRIMKEGRE